MKKNIKKKTKLITLLIIVLAIIITLISLLLMKHNNELNKNKIEILDATYVCKEALEQFYEDNNYTYSFSCVKSDSVYVKLPNGNKMLVVDALEEEKVTINELEKAGLEFIKTEK